ncbi:MAG: glutaredoxin family protein [Acidobacteria bacterium]|nr:glutaredoxin family protein [Acidobacteriota bacterium]
MSEVSIDGVVIYGKDSCPYTADALASHKARGAAVEYVNVTRDAAGMERMLALTGGQRRVPVIVEGGQVTIGFGGT